MVRGFIIADVLTGKKESELKDLCSWLRERGFVLDLVKSMVDI